MHTDTNKRKRVLLVFGTRPEAIKMCPLVKTLQRYPELFDTEVCVTAQHRQMLDQVLDVFDVKPDDDLDIMRSEQDLYDVTTRVLVGMHKVLDDRRPDVVLVHGDTTTSFAASLAAFYCQIRVGHVEAGLRTRNPLSPWPEEMNRQLTGRIAAFHFAPTNCARDNLMNETVSGEIIVTGNTVIDALHMVVDRLHSDQPLSDRVAKRLYHAGYDLNRLTSGTRRMVLITGHRRENFGEGFQQILTAIKTLSLRFPDVDFVYPMHLNPNVRRPIGQLFSIDTSHAFSQPAQNLFFIEPLEYLEFVTLMEHCHLVLTDSGGIQEEAPGLGKPVLVMRDTTERPEAVEAGTVLLVGARCSAIVDETARLLTDTRHYATMSLAVNPYGDGHACERIADFLRQVTL